MSTAIRPTYRLADLPNAIPCSPHQGHRPDITGGLLIACGDTARSRQLGGRPAALAERMEARRHNRLRSRRAPPAPPPPRRGASRNQDSQASASDDRNAPPACSMVHPPRRPGYPAPTSIWCATDETTAAGRWASAVRPHRGRDPDTKVGQGGKRVCTGYQRPPAECLMRAAPTPSGKLIAPPKAAAGSRHRYSSSRHCQP